MKKIMLRLGVTIEADAKETEAILAGDGKVLAEVIRKNGFALMGNSCIPAESNKELGIDSNIVIELN